jgi:cytochrome c553
VPCAACHGPNAEGIRDIPRLGGLSYGYLKRRLEQWGQGYHAAAPPPMPRIAGKLPPGQIEALASYLSFLN